MCRLGTRGAVRSVVLAVLLATGRAQAQSSTEDRAAAQALFDEGRSLILAGRAGDACPKFEESQSLDPGIGTQLNLADCFERVGKTASAWTLYVELSFTARNAGQTPRAEHAAARAEALKGKLSRLAINVPEPSRVAGLTIRRGSVTVGAAQWGLGVPVDPGTHVVTASAPGKRTYETKVDVAANNANAQLTIPILKSAPRSEATSPIKGGTLEPTRDNTTSGAGGKQKTFGLIAAGVGVVGVAVGGFFGVRALGKKGDADCDGRICGSSEDVTAYEDAQSAGNISTIAFIAGGVALAGGAVLYFTAPSNTRGSKVHAAAHATPNQVELTAGATF